MGHLEKRILSFLKQAGIHESVIATDEFHLRIENEPYSPLGIAQDETDVTLYSQQIERSVASAVTKPVKRVTSPVQSPSLKKIADSVREADLETVAANLGLEPDSHDQHKWRDAQHTISISGQLFMDWRAEQGGGGAIDLVMHVRGVGFKDAVAWLSGQELTMRPAHIGVYMSPAKSASRALGMPVANERRWLAVKEYLVETRKLPAPLIDRLHEKGLIYADEFQNAVFVRHQLQGGAWRRGKVTGASLRGTWGEHNAFHGMAPGTVRNQGWFWISKGHGPVQRVLLTESPIDAMSLAVLDRAQWSRSGVAIYLSTDGVGGIPKETLASVLKLGGVVVAAFDSDQAGELMAWRTAQALSGLKRLRPTAEKDWNSQLQSGRPIHLQPSHDAKFKTFRSLWQWYSVAITLGKSAAYLYRITEVAQEVVKGGGLSAKAHQAMLADLAEGERCTKLSLTMQ